MNARQRRDARRAPLRRAYARSQQISTRDAMKPAVGGRSKVSYQGSASGGYGSDWSRAAHVGGADKPILIDARWSSTLRDQ